MSEPSNGSVAILPTPTGHTREQVQDVEPDVLDWTQDETERLRLWAMLWTPFHELDDAQVEEVTRFMAWSVRRDWRGGITITAGDSPRDIHIAVTGKPQE